MPAATLSYVFLQNGAHTRQPRTGAFGFTPNLVPGVPGFATQSLGNYPQYSQFSVPGFQSIRFIHPNDYKVYFAFVTISDGVNALTWTKADESTPFFTVGTTPIKVFVVYVTVDVVVHIGTGKNGAIIDAFNETTLQLIDDNFVTVSPDDANNDLTSSGNQKGFVPSDIPNSETISAIQNIEPSNASFVQWINLLQYAPPGPNPQPSGPPFPEPGSNNLVAAPGSNYFALAIYKSPTPQQIVYPHAPVGLVPTVILQFPDGVVEIIWGNKPGAPVVVNVRKTQ
jgi:hypothetical protein